MSLGLGAGNFGSLTAKTTKVDPLFENGKLIGSVEIVLVNGLKMSETKYDNDNNKISIGYFNTAGENTGTTTFAYTVKDENKTLSSITHSQRQGQDELILTLGNENKFEMKMEKGNISNITNLAEFFGTDEVKTQKIKGTEINDLTFMCDDEGNLLEIRDNGRLYQQFTDDGVETFEYDKNGKLKRSVTDKGVETKYEIITNEGDEFFGNNTVLKAIKYQKGSIIECQYIEFPNDCVPETLSGCEFFALQNNINPQSIYFCDTSGKILKKEEYVKNNPGEGRSAKSVIYYNNGKTPGVTIEFKTDTKEISNEDDKKPKKSIPENIILGSFNDPSLDNLSSLLDLEFPEENKINVTVGNKNVYIYEYSKDDKAIYLKEDDKILQKIELPEDITLYNENGSLNSYKTGDKVTEFSTENGKTTATVKDKNGNEILKKTYTFENGKCTVKETSGGKTYTYTIDKNDKNNENDIILSDIKSGKRSTKYEVTGIKAAVTEKSIDNDDYIEIAVLHEGFKVSDYEPPSINKPNTTLTLTDEEGKVLAVYKYDAYGYLDKNESSTEILYDENGNFYGFKARNGKCTEYDENGRISSIYSQKTDKNGNEITTRFNPDNGKKISVECAGKYTETYDNNGGLTVKLEAGAELSDYTAPKTGRANSIVYIMDEKGNKIDGYVAAVYDADGNIIQQSTKEDQKPVFDDKGRLKAFTAKNGNFITFDYEGDMVKQTKYKKNPANLDTKATKKDIEKNLLEIKYYGSADEMSSGYSDNRSIYECDREGNLLCKNVELSDGTILQYSYMKAPADAENKIKIGDNEYVLSATTEIGPDGYPEKIILEPGGDITSIVLPETFIGTALPIYDEYGECHGVVNYDEYRNLYSLTDADGDVLKSVIKGSTTTYEYKTTESGEKQLSRAVCDNGNVTKYEYKDETLIATKYNKDPDAEFAPSSDGEKVEPLKILTVTEYSTKTNMELFRETYKYDKNGSLTQIEKRDYTPKYTDNTEKSASLNSRICLESLVRKGTETLSTITAYKKIEGEGEGNIKIGENNYKITAVSEDTGVDGYIDEIVITGDVSEYTPPLRNEANAVVKAYNEDGQIVAVYVYGDGGSLLKGESSTKITYDEKGNAQSVSNNGKVTKYDSDGKITEIYQNVIDKATGAIKSVIHFNPVSRKKETEVYYNKNGQESAKYKYNEKGSVTEINLISGNLSNFRPPLYNADGTSIKVYEGEGENKTLCAEYMYKKNGSLDYAESIVEYTKNEQGDITAYKSANGNITKIRENDDGTYSWVKTKGDGSAVLSEITYFNEEEALNKKNPISEVQYVISKNNSKILTSTKTDFKTGEIEKYYCYYDEDTKASEVSYTEKYDKDKNLIEVTILNEDKCKNLPKLTGPADGIVTVKDENGTFIAKWSYDKNFKLSAVLDENNKITQTYKNYKLDDEYEYDTSGKLSRITNKKNNTVTDINGNVATKYVNGIITSSTTYEAIDPIIPLSENKVKSETKYDRSAQKKETVEYDTVTGKISRKTEHQNDKEDVTTEYQDGNPSKIILGTELPQSVYDFPLTGTKNQKITIEDGQSTYTLQYSSSSDCPQIIDENGRIIAECDKKGKYTFFEYYDNGTLKSQTTDNVKKCYDEKGVFWKSEIIPLTDNPRLVKKYEKTNITPNEKKVVDVSKTEPPENAAANSALVYTDANNNIRIVKYNETGYKTSDVTYPTKNQYGYRETLLIDQNGRITIKQENNSGTSRKESTYGSWDDFVNGNPILEVHKDDSGNKIREIKLENGIKSDTSFKNGKPQKTTNYIASMKQSSETISSCTVYSENVTYTETKSLGKVFKVEIESGDINCYEIPKTGVPNSQIEIKYNGEKYFAIYNEHGVLSLLKKGDEAVKTYDDNGNLQYIFENGKPVNFTYPNGRTLTWKDNIATVSSPNGYGSTTTTQYASVDDIIAGKFEKHVIYPPPYNKETNTTVIPTDGLSCRVIKTKEGKEISNEVYTLSNYKLYL